MRRHRVTGPVFAMIAALAMATQAAAGGWATVEMEKPVTRVETGTPLTIEFRLLQHGDKPTDWTTTYVEARNVSTGETLRFDATNGEQTGDWVATLTFPSAGEWEWAIKTDELFVETTFPAIDVVGDAAPVGNTAGITQAQLDTAITAATEPLGKQIASLTGDIETLEKQVASLTGERDTLQKQIANLEAAQADESASAGVTWWVAALAGAGSAIVVVAIAAAIALRRGVIRSAQLAPA